MDNIDKKGINFNERIIRKINEANCINKGIEDYAAGRTVNGKSALKRLRKNHGMEKTEINFPLENFD